MRPEDQDGIIRKKAPTRATLESVRRRFLHVGGGQPGLGYRLQATGYRPLVL